ncbi:hypothetical protein BDY24DRAFT_399563 [Mrakia frigida]|uniref:uncharacterized protein n=1 Tax=Mrakia frigida TaxID=29902 RepID=UPI003FCBF9E6
MTSPSTLLPLLLRHSLPHIPTHGFSLESLSLASLSLPPPYHYSQPLNSAGISTLFGRGREPQRALVKEWLMDKRGEMQREWKGKGKEGRMSSTLLHQILENRLRMNEEVRPWLAEAFALFSITSTPLPLVGVGLKTPFPLLNHSLHIADEALALSSSHSRQNLHESIPLSFIYLSAELHQLSLPLSQPSMPSTSAFLARRLEEYQGLQKSVGEAEVVGGMVWDAIRGGVKSRF